MSTTKEAETTAAATSTTTPAAATTNNDALNDDMKNLNIAGADASNAKEGNPYCQIECDCGKVCILIAGPQVYRLECCCMDCRKGIEWCMMCQRQQRQATAKKQQQQHESKEETPLLLLFAD